MQALVVEEGLRADRGPSNVVAQTHEAEGKAGDAEAPAARSTSLR